MTLFLVKDADEDHVFVCCRLPSLIDVIVFVVLSMCHVYFFQNGYVINVTLNTRSTFFSNPTVDAVR